MVVCSEDETRRLPDCCDDSPEWMLTSCSDTGSDVRRFRDKASVICCQENTQLGEKQHRMSELPKTHYFEMLNLTRTPEMNRSFTFIL